MLTLQQAHEVRISIIEYLRATFTFKERAVGKALMDFITHEEDGLFSGPFLSAKLPFVRAGEGEEIPLDIKPPFPPFDHQLKSFLRLTTQGGHVPEPTILTTGTGSGKTESFLYPLLDYCYQRKGQDGIKAIILYPMNALATDQAGRLAEAIHSDPLLKGKIRAGLFIGSGGQKNDLPKMMGETHLVEDLDTILDAPPDILLTNFKMLDYALMRSKYHRLWRLNLGNPSLLKFLVLDELHTYDGAQGTDVANLIRRLKLKLDLSKGQLCPIGTSATIGTGEDAPKLLADYATKIFGETITPDAMVTELRETTEVFFNKKAKELDSFLPSAVVLQDSELTDDETYESYLLRQQLVWNIDEAVDEVVLGSKLRELRIVWDVLEICQRGHTTEAQLILELNRINPDFRQLPERSGGGDFNPKMGVIRSLFALLAAGKVSNDSGRRFPLLYLQVQLWIRELSGLQRVVATEPKFQWRNQIGQTMLAENALPPWFCRDCGASGWLMVKYDNRNHFENDILEVYDKFFSNHKNLYFVNTDTADHRAIEGYEATTTHTESVHPISMELSSKKLDNYIPVIAYRQANGNYSRHICPECNSRNSISIIGTRTATLASITTSQVISSDLDIQLEQDRKLLAFTNGVQDAAHQAGFIEARNYRFTFRSALQRVVQLQKEPIRLSDLQQQFIDYWKEKADDSGKRDLAAYLYKFFPSDKVGKVNMESYRFKNGKFKETFIKEFDLRTGWDIVSEYGYNALVGRTLAKTKTSSAFVDNERVKLVFAAFKNWLEENNLGMIEQQTFELFLNGLLHRLRVRGGIEHTYLQKFRTGSLRHWDLNWNRDKRHFLNKGFGSNTRLPKMLTANYSRDFVDSTYTDKENWFHAYFRKSFSMASDHQPIVNEFFKKLLPLLAQEEIGLLDKKESDQIDNYCLKPSAVLVENGVETLECDSCGHLIRSTKSGFEHLQDTSCLSYRCAGHYQHQIEDVGKSYYQKVYNRQRTPRIYAADHTGLLPRKEREEKEIDFKERPRFNSLNALVATSTLEMGIDIGDLNTAMNTSVPPLPSNFLQRVGRAGRKSGSALLINFAGNDKHDQFYFEEPVEMMAGQVHPPGCFLEAKEILKRHFFAFCVDSWTTADPEKHLIPSMLIHIKPINIDLQAPSFFANQLILFIQNQETALFEQFKSAYGSEVADSTFDELKRVLHTKHFYRSIEESFQNLVQEYRNIREKRLAILKDIKDRKLGKQDDERLELVQQLKNLRGTLKTLGRRQFLEHLTNVGLLPNYAFPETGVTLTGRVVKQKGEDALKTPTPVDIEIVRPARQAIKELIPDNYFYTQGYKLLITGLNVQSWEEESKIMRYCSNCDYVDDQEMTTVMCPKCGDPSFGSTSNTHRFLQLKAVKSFNKEENAALDDGSDERLSEIALRTHHFRFDKSIVQGAYAIRSVPFGIEYVTELEIFEVNSGLRKEVMNRSRKTTINGKEVPVEGYITCRYCGCSSAQIHKQDKGKRVPKTAQDYHYPYCKHKAKIFEPQSGGVFEEVFLYRTMMTEALKILLPVQEFETQSSVAMFMSGIALGLRKFYNGNPQHIGIYEYREFNGQTGRFDQYVILYDLVPGGTGYLSKLFTPEAFGQVLELAYKGIRDCKCQHHNKDGCYHCIFSYGNRYFQEELSRRKAEDLFYRIIRSNNKWEFMPNGISNITNDGQIEESELEERFIRALRNFAGKKEQQELGWTFEEINENGIIHYRLLAQTERNSFEYLIQPQYPLGKSQGVELATVADFMVRCLAGNVDGKVLTTDEVASILPIAIYLDGYQYHATKENPRFEKDVAKRVSILHSNQFLTWTMTYDDLKFFEAQLSADKETKNIADKFDRQSKLLSGLRQKIQKLPGAKGMDTDIFKKQNSLSRLLWLMTSPTDNHIAATVKTYLFCLQSKFGEYLLAEKDVKSAITANQSFTIIDTKHRDKGGNGFCYLAGFPATVPDFQMQLALRLKDFNPLFSLFVKQPNRGYDLSSWNVFWQLFNLLQLIVEQPDDLEYLSKETGFMLRSTLIEEEDLTIENEEVYEYFDDEFHPIIEQLLVHKLPFDKDGSFVLLDKWGNVEAEGILGFPSLKIVFESFEDYESVFKEMGYKILLPSEFTDELISEIKISLKNA